MRSLESNEHMYLCFRCIVYLVFRLQYLKCYLVEKHMKKRKILSKYSMHWENRSTCLIETVIKCNKICHSTDAPKRLSGTQM